MIINGAFGMLSYTDIKANAISKEEALKELAYYRIHANNRTHCMIDYEKLITIEVKFKDDAEIQEIILQLKKQIAKNYLLKEKLKKRICLIK